MSSPDKNGEALTAQAIENTRRYFLAMCDEPDGPDTVMIGRVCDAALASLSARKSTERVIEAARKAVKHNNFIVGMKDTDPGKGPMNYLADALAEFDASTDGSIAK